MTVPGITRDGFCLSSRLDAIRIESLISAFEAEEPPSSPKKAYGEPLPTATPGNGKLKDFRVRNDAHRVMQSWVKTRDPTHVIREGVSSLSFKIYHRCNLRRIPIDIHRAWHPRTFVVDGVMHLRRDHSSQNETLAREQASI